VAQSKRGGGIVPDGAGPSPAPTPSEAAGTLRDLDAIGDRSRRIVHAGFTRLPLLVWGVAWLGGYSAFDLLPFWPAVLIGGALWVLAALSSRFHGADEVVSSWQRSARRSWLVLVAASPLLVLAIMPVPAGTVLLLLGALWGVALALFAVATGDRPLGAVGWLVLVAAACCRFVVPGHGLLVFALVAGGAMAVLGAVRTVGEARRG
jgi:hypothetical protein